MDEGTSPYEDHHTPPPPSRRWRVPRAAVAAGLASFLGLAGAGAAFAFTGTPSRASTSSATTPSTPPSPPHAKMVGPGLRGLPALGGVVHGQYTVASGSGYKTILVQAGTVVTVSGSSIEVKSADGYDHVYSVVASTVVDAQENGIATVAKGDTVRVQAVQQSGQDVATAIVDTTKVRSSRNGFGLGRMTPFGQKPPAPPSANQAGIAD